MKKKSNIPPKVDPLINPGRPNLPLGGENSQRPVKAKLSRKKKAGQPRKQADTLRTLHELQTHKVELEMQNEELTRARATAEEVYRQYTDLYDFAPVGYFTLGRDGTIRQVNLAGANLLGIERAKLINRRLGRFVSKESRSVYDAFQKELLSREGKATCEVAFKRKGKHPLWARIEATCLEGGRESRAVMVDITERKQVELELIQSEAKFRSTFDQSPVGLVMVGLDKCFIKCNSAFCNFLGYTEAELIGKTISDVTHPEDQKIGMSEMKRLEEEKTGTFTVRKRYIRKDGAIVWGEVCICLVCDANNEPAYFLPIIQDITERKQVEEALRESERRSRIVSELTTDYIFIVDVAPDGELRLDWASDSMLRMTGRTVEDAETPDLWKNMIHPDDNARFFDFANQILNTAKAGQLECRSIYKNGEERWILILARPQIGEGNRVTSIVGAIKDVTERKQAEEALKKSQEKFQAIADYTVDWESWFGPDGKYLWVNPGVEEVTGYSPKEILAMPDFISTIVMDEDRNNFIERFHEAIHGSRGKNFEFRYLHKNGTKRWLSISWQPIFDAKGEPLGTRASGRDITERKQMEDELRRTRESLTTINIELQDALVNEKQLAYIDSLTGINNRRRLYELAEYEFEIAARYVQPLSVMMFDIDHFKQVNDTFGHAVGDQILQAVTQVASAELRSADVIGRYGGEEFVIILPMTTAQQAYPLAERIRKRVAAIRVQTEDGDAAVTISTGIVEIRHNTQNESAEYMIRRADEAMYTAKQAGRNRTEIGNP